MHLRTHTFLRREAQNTPPHPTPPRATGRQALLQRKLGEGPSLAWPGRPADHHTAVPVIAAALLMDHDNM